MQYLPHSRKAGRRAVLFLHPCLHSLVCTGPAQWVLVVEQNSWSLAVPQEGQGRRQSSEDPGVVNWGTEYSLCCSY